MQAILETTLSETTLSGEASAKFRRDGFLVQRGLFSPEEAASIRDAFMAQARNGPVPGLSEMKHGNQQYDAADPLAFYPRMMNPHSHPELPIGPVALDFLLNPRLHGILRDLLEEEPVGVQTMFYFKPAGARGQALHQDNFYLRVKPGTCMAAWLAVDDADAENGGMVVVPGTRDMDVVCPEKADAARFFTTDLVPVPEGLREEPITLKAGDVLFFNGSVIHGSYPNSSTDRFRRSLIAHYVPRDSQEMAHWYESRLTFDGSAVSIADAAGGGPCGTAQMDAGRH